MIKRIPLSKQLSLPIGVFDSGMGGLTVLRALRQVLPNEDFTYLGDTARLPYGTKSPGTVEKYASQAAEQLIARGVKALVIACNTASAFALTHLQAAFAPTPVFGVIDPGADAAAAAADQTGVLVLATESTIRGGAYQRALAARAPNLPIFGRACPLWVTLAEQGPQTQQLTDTVLRDALRGFAQAPKTLLLGCTHFPVFSASLKDLLDDITVVDSAATTAAVVVTALSQAGLRQTAVREGEVNYMATDGAVRFRKVGLHFLGEALDHVELIDL